MLSLGFHLKVLSRGNILRFLGSLQFKWALTLGLYMEGQAGAEVLHSPLANGFVYCLAR